MAEYVPVYTDTDTVTLTLSAACVGKNVLVVSGDGTAAPSAGASPSVVGVAEFDAASGSRVAVNCGRIQELVAAGAITAGDQVVSAAAGAVASLPAAAGATIADINNARNVIGIALTTAANAANVRVLWIK